MPKPPDDHRNIESNPDEYQRLVQSIERKDLDSINEINTATLPEVSRSSIGDIDKFQFIKITAIARSIPAQKIKMERYLMEDVLSGLGALKTPFIYLVLGLKSSINIYLGVSEHVIGQDTQPNPGGNNLNILTSSLYSTFPNIEIKILDKNEIKDSIYGFFSNCRHYGIMTGIPTPKSGVEEYGVEQIERLLRGLYQQEFGYMVVSTPIDDTEVMTAFDDLTTEIKNKSGLAKESRQYMQTHRLTTSGETTNRQIQYYLELLEVLLDKLKLAKSIGLWRSSTYFFSPSSGTIGKMKNLLKVVFSGDKSTPEPIRTFNLTGNHSQSLISQFRQLETKLDYSSSPLVVEHPLSSLMKYKFTAILNSRDLATLTHLPKEEMPGYNVKDTARFGVCLPPSGPEPQLVIGEIMDRGVTTGNYYSIKINDLTKHGLIAGVTGSGKTNTCFNLLYQLWSKHAIPFLVIEPAKGEYRALSRVSEFQNLQIFTLGEETVAPFRLNPFEILAGVTVQAHIDHLKSVFNASFVMFAPMPYVLERCIHEIYQDKGWDLITNNNRYKGQQPNIFPTLTDLYEKIDTVVDRLGYEDRITMDVKAALKTRVGSLRIGGKGAMLDTPLSIPIDNLLSKPTILELQKIGDDEEKSFIIGLLLARLYEFRQTERKSSAKQKIKHITVIEEAHRLLTRTSPDSGDWETVNTKAKAVETFCNILSEIRAYGEGILIAEQIPVKLASDAIKNSNLKIMHRIVAQDDRDCLGSAMNLLEEQKRYVSIMDSGLAVTFSEGVDESFLVKAPYFPDVVRLQEPQMVIPADAEVRQFMAKTLSTLNYIYGRQKGCAPCRSKCRYLDRVRQVSDSLETQQIFGSYLLSIIENEANFLGKYDQLKELLLKKTVTFSLAKEESEDLSYCYLVNTGHQFIQLKGKQYNLSFLDTNSLIDTYSAICYDLFKIKIDQETSLETTERIKQFQQLYKEKLQIVPVPFPGCNEFCQHKCLFRFEVEPLVKNTSLDNGLDRAVGSGNGAKINVRNFCIQVAKGITQGENPEFIENIALCFFIQKYVQWEYEEIIKDIKKWFLIKPSEEGQSERD